jgi:hypothetical protein
MVKKLRSPCGTTRHRDAQGKFAAFALAGERPAVDGGRYMQLSTLDKTTKAR